MTQTGIEPATFRFIPQRLNHCATAVVQWLRCCATNRKVAYSTPAGVSEFFIDIKSFRSHYGPVVDSAPNTYDYQEHFLGQRRPVRKSDKLSPSCAVVMKSGNLNFMGPPGSLQAYNGADAYLNHCATAVVLIM